jgi:hypothetical protein
VRDRATPAWEIITQFRDPMRLLTVTGKEEEEDVFTRVKGGGGVLIELNTGERWSARGRARARERDWRGGGRGKKGGERRGGERRSGGRKKGMQE